MADEIVVEKGIAIPEPNGARNDLREVMAKMEILDSFVYPKLKAANVQNVKPFLKPKKFTIRTVSAEQIRVWRKE